MSAIPVRSLVAALLVTVALGGCGGGGRGSGEHHDGGSGGGAANTVHIYSSLPTSGPSARHAAAIVRGIRLALTEAGSRAGQFTVVYRELSDSSPQAEGWDPAKTVQNARTIATDPRAIYAIGDFDSGASELSIPILNEAGVALVSPSSTYVGLTTRDPGSVAGEPERYAPTGHRTFFRLIGRDTVQAGADLEAMGLAHCGRVAVVSDQEAYGRELAALLAAERLNYAVNIIGVPIKAIGRSATSIDAYAAALKHLNVDCVEYAGLLSGGGVRLTEAVHAVLPKAKFFAPAPMCTSRWTNAKRGGVPTEIDPLLQCTEPVLGVSAYPGARSFLDAYTDKYGIVDPDPYAILGYEAMKLGLDTIHGLGAEGDNRGAVVAALFAMRSRASVLGTYHFDACGDTTLLDYGLYKVGSDHDPRFVRTLRPPLGLEPGVGGCRPA